MIEDSVREVGKQFGCTIVCDEAAATLTRFRSTITTLRAELAEAKAALEIPDTVPAESEIKQSKRLLYFQIKSLHGALAAANAELDREHLLRVLYEDAAKDWQPRAERAEAKVKELREALERFVDAVDRGTQHSPESGSDCAICDALGSADAALQSCDAPAKTVGEP